MSSNRCHRPVCIGFRQWRQRVVVSSHGLNALVLHRHVKVFLHVPIIHLHHRFIFLRRSLTGGFSRTLFMYRAHSFSPGLVPSHDSHVCIHLLLQIEGLAMCSSLAIQYVVQVSAEVGDKVIFLAC